MFKKIYQIAPVTVLESASKLLLSGSGGTFQVYDLEKKAKIFEKHVFMNASIHGIKVFCSKEVKYVVVYGAKQLSILNYEDYHIICTHACHDWILDVSAVNYKCKNHLAVALAHNNVVMLDWNTNEIVLEVHCKEKCILYSAHFIDRNKFTEWEDLALCAGTVFNQVVVWFPGQGLSDERVEVVERITGHDGVLFGIHYDALHKLLLTTSDDRSIRIWSSPTLSRSTHKLLSWRCLAVLYGHEARIWRVRSFELESSIYLISVAEDGFCIIWKILSLEAQKAEVAVEKKINLRGNLLCLSVNKEYKFSVGCANGSIYVFDARKLLCRESVVAVERSESEKCGKAKFVRILSNLSSPSVLVHTDAGFLFLYNLQTSMWRVLYHDQSYGSYAVLSVDDSNRMVAVGNTSGSVLLLSLNDDDISVGPRAEINDFDGKILSLSWYDCNLFISGKGGCLKWYTVEAKDSYVKASLVTSFILPLAKHRWHTAVSLLSASNLVVCGDRRGSVHLFRKGPATPTQTFHGVHGKNGVTSVRTRSNTILTTGRDGYWRTFLLANASLEMLSKRRAAQRMDWLEKTWLSRCEKETRLSIWGFHGNRFVIWSSFSGNELYSLPCGGCHRSWDFSPSIPAFVFLKASQLNIAKIPYNVFEEPLLSHGLHSQQITSARFLAHYSIGGERVNVIVSASEDTKVLITAVVESFPFNKMKTLHVLDDHCSSVRSVCVHTISESDTSVTVHMATAGSRGALNIYHVTILTHSPPNDSSCLVKHIASFQELSNLVPDVRYMSVATLDKDGNELAVACSDGKVRRFQVDSTSIKMTDLSNDCGHCYLSLTRMSSFIVAGATDGCVYLMTSQLKEALRIYCHQSGINSLACCEVTVTRQPCFLLATAGDDNAINLILLRHSNCETKELARHNIPNAHSSQVTGLHLRQRVKGAELFSTSIDQRIVRFSVVVHGTTVECIRLECSFLHIADVASLDVSSGRFLVSGRGLVCGKCEEE